MTQTVAAKKSQLAALNIGMLLLILALLAVIVHPILDKSCRPGPRALTAIELGRLEGYILDFHEDHQAWPDVEVWKTQLKPYFERYRTVSSKQFATDAWGGDIEYLVRTNLGQLLILVRSLGPNKKNDYGTNDDIVLEVFNPDLKK